MTARRPCAEGGARDLGDAALVQVCQVHEMLNILEYLSHRHGPWAQAILRRAYQAADPKLAQRRRLDLARRLEAEYPSAAESVRERLDETLTVLTLKLSPRLRRSLATTNAAESLLSRTRQVKRNVKRWRSGQMMLQWVAVGFFGGRQGLPPRDGILLTCRCSSPHFVHATDSSASTSLRRSDRSRSRQLGRGESQQPDGHPHRAPVSR